MINVTSFFGEYRFLSNFWPCEIEYQGQKYRSVEHAYQAAKTLIWEERQFFLESKVKASDAKQLGKLVTLREDWDQVKRGIMFELVLQKFQNPSLKEKLLAIDGQIIEGNNWGDTYWGECPLGNGENNLGKILMAIRNYY